MTFSLVACQKTESPNDEAEIQEEIDNEEEN